MVKDNCGDRAKREAPVREDRGGAAAGVGSVIQPVVGIRIDVFQVFLLAVARRIGIVNDGYERYMIAGIERIIPDAGHASRDRDGVQRGTPGERPISDIDHAVRDRDGGHGFAIGKRTVPDAGHAVRNRDGGQGFAAAECIFSNDINSIRNDI